MHQLKSSNNSPYKDDYSHPIHTSFVMIASYVLSLHIHWKILVLITFHIIFHKYHWVVPDYCSYT